MVTALKNVIDGYGENFMPVGRFKEYTIFQDKQYFIAARDSETLGNGYMMLVNGMGYHSKWYDDDEVKRHLTATLGTSYRHGEV